MALGEFLHGIQTARNVVFPYQAGSFPLPPDRDKLDYTRLRRAAPIWLSTHTVAGYDSNDLHSIRDEDRDQLTALVRNFRAIAGESAEREPTDAELKSGLAYLTALITILDGLMLDAEGKALLAAVYRSKIGFPDFVLGLDYTLGTDATGDAGIWIWVIVPDDVDPDSIEFRQFSARFHKEVRRALAEIKSERLPYIHFRLLSEAVEAMNEGVA